MHALDNPIWQALTTCQAHFAKSSGTARKFLPDISLLAGFEQPTQQGYESLASVLERGERAGLFLQSPPAPSPKWKIILSIPLLQMIHEKSQPAESKQIFVQLAAADVPEMLALTQLTKPGPFNQRTHEMGDYFGIRKDGKLVAMSGERLRLPGFSEISAVCTRPDHLGQGHASALMSLLIERIRSRGETPFLHVRPDNTRAIAVYERLGFSKRALLQYAILESIP